MKHLPLIAALVAVPALAVACPVCGAATEDNRMAYLGMTIVMSLLPLVGFGGIAWWVWKRSKETAQIPD